MLTLYKFEADWCHHCKTVDKFIKEAINNRDTVDFRKINVDNDELGLVNKYNIKGLPTLIFVDESKNFMKKLVGTTPAFNIEKIIKEWEKL